MQKYPKIHHLGSPETKNILKHPHDRIAITEKLDGSNFRVARQDGEITFGSNNVDHIENKNNADQFMEAIEYVKNKVDPEDLDPDVIYVGEHMTKHSLEYDWDETPTVIGFDVIQPDNGNPLGLDFARQEFEEIGIPFVPVLFDGKAKELEDYEGWTEFMQDSEYRQGKPEGIVIKNYDRLNAFDKPLFAKVRTDKFKEKNTAKFGKNKPKKNNTTKVYEQYVTEARIRKIINKMVKEEGRKLQRELMEDLRHRVAKDALVEHIIEVYEDQDIKEIDFRLFDKLVPDKCLEVLDEMIEEQAE